VKDSHVILERENRGRKKEGKNDVENDPEGVIVASLSPERQGTMNLSFAGCGFLGIYHVGVAVCFKKYAPHLLLNKLSGASAGAIAACCLLCDLPLGEWTHLSSFLFNCVKRHTELVFLLDCLRFCKLPEILCSVWCNFSNLLKRKQSSRKTNTVCRWLKTISIRSCFEGVRKIIEYVFPTCVPYMCSPIISLLPRIFHEGFLLTRVSKKR